MLFLSDVLVLCLVFIITYCVWNSRKRPKNFPPGPNGVPILGYLPFVDAIRPHKTVTTLAKTYGDIFSLRLGSRDVVYLNSYDVAKEAFNHPHFQGRPDFETFKVFGPSLVASDGSFGEFHRRFTVRHLREFGFGKASLENVIGKEAEKLVQRFRQKSGKPFQMSTDVNITILNIIWHMVASLNFDETDPDCERLINLGKEAVEAFNSCSLADFLPWMARVFPDSVTRLAPHKALVDNMAKYTQTLIDEHEETLDIENPRDFIDVFLSKIRKEDENCVKESWFRYDVLRASMLDLFVAGSDTSATTIKDTILLLTQNPDVQEKVKQEIRTLTGGERNVTLEDRRNLPYLEAVIMESQRHSTIAPFGLPHYTTENATLGEYEIPKGTVVIANIWAIHSDEKHWSDPIKFKPNRFLNEDGSVNYKKEGYMPFSIGKRLCLGEQLARAELFLFMGYLLQKFTFSTPADASPVSVYDASGGGVIHTDPFEVIALES